MPSTVVDVPIFVIACVSLVVYIFYLLTLYKYRNKQPFDQSFFSILFHIGIFDVLMMLERQVLYRFPGRGWLGMDEVVLKAPRFYAKLHTILFWYLVKPQVLGTLLLTINRFWAIVFNHTWTDGQNRCFLVAVWLMPLPFNIPLWNQGFYYVNATGGGVLLMHDDKNFQFYYMAVCFVQCVLLVIIGIVCYSWIFVHSWRHRTRNTQSSASGQRHFNIIFVGCVLTVLTFECAVACGLMAYSTDPETLSAALPWFDVGTELYCWINPYCLLITSKALRKHFLATVLCKNVNELQVVPSNRSNKQTPHATRPSSRQAIIEMQVQPPVD